MRRTYYRFYMSAIRVNGQAVTMATSDVTWELKLSASAFTLSGSTVNDRGPVEFRSG